MKRLTFSLFVLISFIANSQDRTVLNLANDDDFTSFSFFDSLGIKDYNLFFTGEDHRFRLSNSDLEVKMFKYLHKKVGARVFLLEFGEGMGYFINKYITDSTNDSEAEATLKDNLSEAYFNLFKNLKTFNESLSASEKFTAVGIDVDREPVYAVKYLEQFLPDSFENVDDSIKIHLEALKAISEYYAFENLKWKDENDEGEDEIFDDKAFISTYKSLNLFIENFDANKDKYTTLLGNNYTKFSKAMVWLREFFYWNSLSSTAQQYLFRENFMENNLKKLFANNPGLKAYGQFGRCHTQINREKNDCNYYYFNSLATRLNNSANPRFKNKVFSCPIFYPNADNFSRETTIDEGLEEMAKKTDEDDIMVFALDSLEFPNQATLARRYSALIINNLEEDKSTDEDEDDETSDSETSVASRFGSRQRTFLMAEAGFKNYNFSDVNSTLGTNFNNQQQFVGVVFGNAANGGFNFTTAIHWFISSESNINDSVSANLGGYSINFRYAKDLLKHRDYDLALGMGFGYERWTNSVVEEFSDVTRKDVLGNNRTTQYHNPSLFLDGGLTFRVHVKWVTFGVFGRYQFDFSNKRWRQNGEIVSNSPNFSLRAYSLGAFLGLNIKH